MRGIQTHAPTPKRKRGRAKSGKLTYERLRTAVKRMIKVCESPPLSSLDIGDDLAREKAILVEKLRQLERELAKKVSHRGTVDEWI